MKQQLKGLICGWLVLVMLVGMLATPAMASPSNSIYLYTGTSPLKAGDSFSKLERPTVSEDTLLSSLITNTPEGATLTGWNLWKFGTVNSGYVIVEKLLTKDAAWKLSADDVGTYANGDYYAFEPLYAYSANIDVYIGEDALYWSNFIYSDDMEERQIALNSALSEQDVLSDLATNNLIGWNFWAVDSGRVSYPEFIEPDGVISADNIYVDNPSLLEAMYAAALVSTDSNALEPQKSFDYTGPVDLELGTPIDEQSDITGALNRPSEYSLDGWKLWNYGASGWVYETDGGSPKTVSVDHSVTYDEFSAVQDMIGDYRYIVIEPIWALKYKIDPQPTSDAPTVGAKETTDSGVTWNDADAEYQWYNFKIDTYSVVKTAAAESELGAYYTRRADYQDGKWETEWASETSKTAHVGFEALKGDVITVKFDTAFSGKVVENSSETEYTYNPGTDTYTYTVTEDGNVFAYLKPDDTTAASKAIFTITVTRPVVGVAVSGQNTNTLSSGIDGNQYVCKVTFENGDVLTSDAVTYTAPPTYTVTFDANGGSDVEEQTIETGNKIIEPTEPARTGYTFGGWYKETSCINAWDFENDTVSEPITLYAKWTAYEITQQPTVDNEYEVKVNPSDGVAYTWHEMTETDVTMDNAEVYTYNDLPSSYNEGWWTAHSTTGMDGTPAYFYINLDAGDIVDITLSRSCTARVNIYYNNQAGQKYEDWKEIDGVSNLTLTAPGSARYYMTVSVRDSGEQPTVKAKVIKAGEAISGQTTNKLTDGTDGTNYVAKITYPDSAVLTSEAVCYVSPSFEVTFDTNGGTNVSKQTVDNGGKVEELTAPTKAGYTFAGWYKDSELETAWDFDTDTVTEPTTLYAKWTAKAEVIINTDVQNYTYDKSAKQFEIKGTSLTGFTVSYKQGETPVINPTNAGTYDVIITRLEDDAYKSYSKTITGGLVINKAVVNVPTVASKVYTGENQTADIPESELYTETSNEGRTTVGTANVVLTLVDSTNYKWSDGTETATKTIEFEITKANVNAITGLDIEGWTYGEDAKLPTASATFGTPNLTYVGTGETNYAESTTPPSNVGTYKVIAKVADTANFVGASDEKEFAIAKATPTYTAPVNLKATYGETLVDVTLPDGWSWKDSSLSVGNAGTNEFTAVFTPQDTTNFEVIEINVSVAVGKTIPSYDIPVDIEATYGDTLADVTLPDGWSWKDSTLSVGNAGTQTFVAVFTPSDTNNYNSVEENITITVAKKEVAEPAVSGSYTYTGNEQTVTLIGVESFMTVSGNKATNAGNYVVTVTLDDNHKWNASSDGEIEWSIAKADMSADITASGYNAVFDNQAHTISVNIPEGASIKYGTLDGTYNLDAAPEYTNAGIYTVYYKVEKPNYNDVTGSADVVIDKKDIMNAEITLGEALTFDGNEQTQAIASATVDGLTITYDVSGNVNTNAGDYTLTITGNGNFEGTAQKTYTIVRKSVEGANVGSFNALTYTGSAQTPAATVTIDGLTATGTWSAVTNVNDKTTFTANGNFTGTIAEQSTGMAKATPVVTAPVAKASLIYNTSALALADEGSTTGGTMQYSPDNATWSNDVPTGTNAGDYTVYYKVVGNSNYNDVAAQSIFVSIAKADMSADITAVGYNAVFDNQAHTISVTIPDGASIKYGTLDGTYELDDAPQYTNVGTYTVYYKVEKANYNVVTGSADVVITAKDISNAEITLGEALTYTDSEQTRDFTVAPLDGLEIDYTVSGNTGKDAGVYTLTISGQGNFTGSKSVSWSIGKASQPAPETPAAVNETIKAKADGKITGVNSDMEYKPENESEYIAITETEIADLAAGTYLVRYKEDANHFAGTYKQVVIENGVMITVSFISNEGTAVDSKTSEYNQAITAPAEPTKENFVFAGWYKDAECLDLWNFGNTLTEDITLYAKWNDKPVYSISGRVTDGESGLGGITVTLKQGNTIIAITTTAADGSYSFITEDGLYNIVAEKEENDNSTIKTVKIEVMESANVNDVVFVATDINSELEIKSDTPQIIVGGLDEEAQAVSSSNGNVDVTVKMTVESTEDITGNDDATGQEQRQTEQKEIKKVSGNRYIQFIEINLTQSISGAESTKLEETTGLIEVIIPFEKGNKRNITVYRYHGSVAEKLGAGIGNANADGEYFEVKENHIVVYAKKFSTYAIGYDLPSSGGGGSSVTRYTVKFDTNGGSSVSSATVTKNAKVAEPKTPEKDGYTFGGWYTDEALTEKYDFDSKVTKNLTLYAKWDKHDDEQPGTDTHNCPSLAFDDLNITKWYHFDTDYVIENGIFKGTTETTFEPDSAQTRAMMVTVLYRVEGEPAVNRSIPFADVDMGAYYANAVIWGQQNGIIKGYSETEFGPDDKITREQIAAIMHRYAQYKGYDVSEGENTNILSYDDFDSISEYAIPSMQWAVGSGLIKGKSESTLNPLDNATRAEIAAILHRFVKAN